MILKRQGIFEPWSSPLKKLLVKLQVSWKKFIYNLNFLIHKIALTLTLLFYILITNILKRDQRQSKIWNKKMILYEKCYVYNIFTTLLLLIVMSGQKKKKLWIRIKTNNKLILPPISFCENIVSISLLILYRICSNCVAPNFSSSIAKELVLENIFFPSKSQFDNIFWIECTFKIV